MEDLEERLVDELLSPDKEAEDRDESMADQNAGAEESVADQNAEAGGEGTKDDKTPEKTEEQKKEEERKKEEEEKKKKEEEERKKREEEEDAASDAEIEAQDERATLPPTGDVKWQWHIELYPIATEDLLLDNFSKLCSTATYSQVVFREPTADVKKGEAHFYAEDVQTAKTLIRTACCKRLAYQRPYIYIYRRKDENSEEFETAVLRLDLLEAAKIRWDRQKRSKGEPATRIVKVSNVPVGTSKDFLSVVFARAYRVKMDTVMSPADAKKAKAAKAAKEKAKAKRKAEAKAAKAAAAAAAKEKEDANEENEADEEEEEEEEDSESEDEDEEMFGKFNG
nr:hypothetical protein BaRGS_023177 [Batillaria attramentaria]